MRRIACALTVALITVNGGFGCHNEKGDNSPDGGGTCSPPVGISVSTASGGFEVFCNGELLGSSDQSGVIKNALCGNKPGTSIQVRVHSSATFIARTSSGAYSLMFDREGDSVLPVRTSVFTTSGSSTVIITVP